MTDDRRSVFISVGKSHRVHYEALTEHLMQILEGHGLRPRVIDKTDPNIGRPLDNIIKVMSECHGAIVIAFERKFFVRGIEKRGSADEYVLQNFAFTTPWSQIEAAMAHQRKLPILMLVEEGIHLEGLIDENYDWFLQYFGKDEDPLGKQNVQNRIAQWAQVVRMQDSARINFDIIIDEKASLGSLFQIMSLQLIFKISGIVAAIFSSGVIIGRCFPSLK